MKNHQLVIWAIGFMVIGGAVGLYAGDRTASAGYLAPDWQTTVATQQHQDTCAALLNICDSENALSAQACAQFKKYCQDYVYPTTTPIKTAH